MPDHRAFLQAIQANPADDGPRLVYADWLDEHGDPCGEFIHVQVARARLRPDEPGFAALLRREVELLVQHRPDWVGPLAEVVSHEVFERGFIEFLLVMADAYLDHAREVVRWAPAARRLKLRDAADQVVELLRSPLPPCLTDLDLGFEHLTPADLAALARWAGLARLTVLTLNGNGLGEEGLERLTRSPGLAGLRELNLEACKLTARSVGLLAGSPHLRRLTAASLCENPLGDAGAAALARAAFLANFTALDLRSTGLGPAGAEALAASPHVGRLEVLRVGYNRLGDAGVRALAASPHLHDLRELDVNDSGLTDAGLDALLTAPFLDGLTVLEVRHNAGLSDAAHDRLTERLGNRCS
jgi:uncharacterized protein (TIGR02996 family)